MKKNIIEVDEKDPTLNYCPCKINSCHYLNLHHESIKSAPPVSWHDKVEPKKRTLYNDIKFNKRFSLSVIFELTCLTKSSFLLNINETFPCVKDSLKTKFIGSILFLKGQGLKTKFTCFKV